MEITTVKQLRKAIKQSKAVFAGICIGAGDPTYIQLVKADILFTIKDWDEVELSFCRLDDDNCLFIN